MVATPEFNPQPVVLIATSDDLSADTFERFVAPYGFAVARTRTGSATLASGAGIRPDAVIVDLDLPDMSATELCRGLMQTRWFDQTVPLLVTTRRDVRPLERLGLFQVGAWDLIAEPLEPREFGLRLRNLVAAKQAADRAQQEGLVDRLTGLYNWNGLQRRGAELAADAFRRHAPLACLAVAADVENEVPPESELQTLVAQLRHVLEVTRQSDVVGRHAGVEFCVLAPRTGPDGAVGLAQRLVRAATTEGTEVGSPLRIKVGYEAVPNLHATPTEADQLLEHALEALRRILRGRPGVRIAPFRPFEYRPPDDLS